MAELYDYLSSHTDIEVVISDSAYQFKKHESNKLQLKLPFKEICTNVEFIQRNGLVLAPWRMALRRDFYLQNGLTFPEQCRIEDVDWACRVLYYAKKIQYIPLLLIHYNKAESGQTDNMYRNIEILRANTVAGNRTLHVAMTLYAESPVQRNIKDMAETYYNFTCRYLFGSYQPLKVKMDIIKLIPLDHSKFRLVNFAIKHPLVFCFLTNMGVLPFRMIRIIRRRIKAKQLEG